MFKGNFSKEYFQMIFKVNQCFMSDFSKGAKHPANAESTHRGRSFFKRTKRKRKRNDMTELKKIYI